MLTLMSGTSLVNSFTKDGSAGYDAISPVLQALISDVASIKTDINWIKRELDMSTEEFPAGAEEIVDNLEVMEALEELRTKVDSAEKGLKKIRPAPKGDYELPDFDQVQKAF